MSVDTAKMFLIFTVRTFIAIKLFYMYYIDLRYLSLCIIYCSHKVRKVLSLSLSLSGLEIFGIKNLRPLRAVLTCRLAIATLSGSIKNDRLQNCYLHEQYEKCKK